MKARLFRIIAFFLTLTMFVLSNAPVYSEIRKDPLARFPVWDDAEELQDGTFRVKQNNKYGLCAPSKELMIPPEWDWIECCMLRSKLRDDSIYQTMDDLYIVVNNGKYGLVNGFMGSYITKATWDEIQPFVSIYSIVKRDERYGVIDRFGKVIVDPVYSKIYMDDNCLIYVHDGKKEGVLYANGSELTPTIWDNVSFFEDGYALVFLDEKYGLIDMHGNVIVEPVCNWISGWNYQCALAEKDGAWWMIDLQNGSASFEPFCGTPESTWYGSSLFGDLIACSAKTETDGNTKDNLLYGYIDMNMQWVIAPQFLSASNFEGGYALVQSKDTALLGVIDRTGTYVVAPDYEEMEHYIDSYYYTYNDAYVGLVNAETSTTFKEEWEDIRVTAAGSIYAIRDGIGFLFTGAGDLINSWSIIP